MGRERGEVGWPLSSSVRWERGGIPKSTLLAPLRRKIASPTTLCALHVLGYARSRACKRLEYECRSLLPSERSHEGMSPGGVNTVRRADIAPRQKSS